MRLHQYLAANDESVAAFAQRIGVASRNTVYRYLRGEQVPRPEIMERIRQATGGAVQPNDFFDEPEVAAE